MNILILKLNATGDVVRTTTLLNRLHGSVTWITAEGNISLFTGLAGVRCLSWTDREAARDREYDVVINLEDEPEQASYAATLEARRRFGACLDPRGEMTYS